MDTERLIEALAGQVRPVRRLPPPERRVLRWLAVAVPAVAMVAGMMGLRPDLLVVLAEPSFVIQELASLATAVAAALAALASTVPGTPRWKLGLPVAPLGLWLASLGHQCWQEWLRFGLSGMEFRPDLICIPAIAMTGAVPALTIVAMARAGAPFRPGLTAALGALAAAALANFGLRLFHPADAALMVLVWQFGSVALMTALAGLAGRRLLPRTAVIRP